MSPVRGITPTVLVPEEYYPFFGSASYPAVRATMKELPVAGMSWVGAGAMVAMDAAERSGFLSWLLAVPRFEVTATIPLSWGIHGGAGE